MRYIDMWSRTRHEKSYGLLCTDLEVLPKIRIRLNYGNVDRYNVLQFATTTVFSAVGPEEICGFRDEPL